MEDIQPARQLEVFNALFFFAQVRRKFIGNPGGELLLVTAGNSFASPVQPPSLLSSPLFRLRVHLLAVLWQLSSVAVITVCAVFWLRDHSPVCGVESSFAPETGSWTGDLEVTTIENGYEWVLVLTIVNFFFSLLLVDIAVGDSWVFVR